MTKLTTIKIHSYTKKALNILGIKGQTYDDIVVAAIRRVIANPGEYKLDINDPEAKNLLDKVKELLDMRDQDIKKEK